MPAASRLNGTAGFLFEAEMAIDEGLEFHYYKKGGTCLPARMMVS
jgi:hypothetical protein